MRKYIITIYDNEDGTYHLAIADSISQSDKTCDSWQELLTILSQLK